MSKKVVTLVLSEDIPITSIPLEEDDAQDIANAVANKDTPNQYGVVQMRTSSHSQVVVPLSSVVYAKIVEVK